MKDNNTKHDITVSLLFKLFSYGILRFYIHDLRSTIMPVQIPQLLAKILIFSRAILILIAGFTTYSQRQKLANSDINLSFIDYSEDSIISESSSTLIYIILIVHSTLLVMILISLLCYAAYYSNLWLIEIKQNQTESILNYAFSIFPSQNSQRMTQPKAIFVNTVLNQIFQYIMLISFYVSVIPGIFLSAELSSASSVICMLVSLALGTISADCEFNYSIKTNDFLSRNFSYVVFFSRLLEYILIICLSHSQSYNLGILIAMFLIQAIVCISISPYNKETTQQFSIFISLYFALLSGILQLTVEINKLKGLASVASLMLFPLAWRFSLDICDFYKQRLLNVLQIIAKEYKSTNESAINSQVYQTINSQTYHHYVHKYQSADVSQQFQIKDIDMIMRMEDLFEELFDVKQLEKRQIRYLSIAAAEEESVTVDKQDESKIPGKVQEVKNSSMLQNETANQESQETQFLFNSVKHLFRWIIDSYDNKKRQSCKLLQLLLFQEVLKVDRMYLQAICEWERDFLKRNFKLKDRQILSSIHSHFKYTSPHQHAELSDFADVLWFEKIIEETEGMITKAVSLKISILAMMKQKIIDLRELSAKIQFLQPTVSAIRNNLTALGTHPTLSSNQLQPLQIAYFQCLSFDQNDILVEPARRNIYNRQQQKENRNNAKHNSNQVRSTIKNGLNNKANNSSSHSQNNNACVLLVSLSSKTFSTQISKVSHNFEKVFKVPSVNVINSPIDVLMPRAIAAKHGLSIADYFNDSMQTEGDNKMMNSLIFGMSADNHLVPLRIAVKLSYFEGQIGIIAEAEEVAGNNLFRYDYILYNSKTLEILGMTVQLAELLRNDTTNMMIAELFPFLLAQQYQNQHESQQQYQSSSYSVAEHEYDSQTTKNKQFSSLKQSRKSSQIPIHQENLHLKVFEYMLILQDYKSKQPIYNRKKSLTSTGSKESLRKLSKRTPGGNEGNKDTLFVQLQIKVFEPKYNYTKELNYLEISRVRVLNPEHQAGQILDFLKEKYHLYRLSCSSVFIDRLIVDFERKVRLSNSNNIHSNKVMDMYLEGQQQQSSNILNLLKSPNLRLTQEEEINLLPRVTGNSRESPNTRTGTHEDEGSVSVEGVANSTLGVSTANYAEFTHVAQRFQGNTNYNQQNMASFVSPERSFSQNISIFKDNQPQSPLNDVSSKQLLETNPYRNQEIQFGRYSQFSNNIPPPPQKNESISTNISKFDKGVYGKQEMEPTSYTKIPINKAKYSSMQQISEINSVQPNIEEKQPQSRNYLDSKQELIQSESKAVPDSFLSNLVNPTNHRISEILFSGRITESSSKRILPESATQKVNSKQESTNYSNNLSTIKVLTTTDQGITSTQDNNNNNNNSKKVHSSIQFGGLKALGLVEDQNIQTLISPTFFAASNRGLMSQLVSPTYLQLKQQAQVASLSSTQNQEQRGQQLGNQQQSKKRKRDSAKFQKNQENLDVVDKIGDYESHSSASLEKKKALEGSKVKELQQEIASSAGTKESGTISAKRRLARILRSTSSLPAIKIIAMIGIISFITLTAITLQQYFSLVDWLTNWNADFLVFGWPSVFRMQLYEGIKQINYVSILKQNQFPDSAKYYPQALIDLGKVLSPLTQSIAQSERDSNDRLVFSSLLTLKVKFIIPLYYDPAIIAGTSSVVSAQPSFYGTEYITSLHYAAIIFNMFVFFLSTNLGTGRPEYYTILDASAVGEALKQSQTKLIEASVVDDKAIKDQLTQLLLIICGVSALCVFLMLPLYTYIQNKKNQTLSLLATFTTDKIDKLIANIEKCLLSSQIRSSIKASNSLKQSNHLHHQGGSQANQIKKQNLSQTLLLPRFNGNLLVILIVIFLFMIIYPIVIQTITSSYLDRAFSHLQVLSKLNFLKSYIIEVLGINYNCLSLWLYPNLKPLKLSWYLSYSQSLSTQASEYQDSLAELSKMNVADKLNEEASFEDIFFPLIDSNICLTIAQFPGSITDTTKLNSSICEGIHKGLLKQGFQLAFKGYLSTIESIRLLYSITDSAQTLSAKTNLFSNFNITDFSVFVDSLEETLSILSNIVVETHIQKYNDIILAHKVLIIYQLVLMALIFGVGWTLFCKHLSDSFNKTRRFLQIIDINSLIENSYILNFLSQDTSV